MYFTGTAPIFITKLLFTNRRHAGSPARPQPATGKANSVTGLRPPVRPWANPSVSPFRRMRCHLMHMLLLLIAIPSAHAEETVVKWPSLKKLDDLAERCEALSEKKDVGGLRKIAAEVKDAAKIVASDAVPEGAKQPGQVKVLQGDLKSLTDSIGDPEKQDGEEITMILAGVHPIVEQLMEASGMPHVHDSEEKEAKPK